MAFNVEELRSNLELNRKDIEHNHSLTNEYMVEDIMQELGYNKRRNKDVKRLVDKPIDWEVLSTGSPNIAVKVFALGDEINNEELKAAMEYSNNKNFSIFIVTNGEALTICRRNKVKHVYVEVCDISLLEDLDETKESILDAISKDGFNLRLIDEIVSRNEISKDKVVEVIENNLRKLALSITSIMGDSSDNMIKQCTEVLQDLFTNKPAKSDNTESEATQSGEFNQAVDISEYTSEIEQLKAEVEQQNAKIEEQNTIIEQLESNAQPIENAQADIDATEYTNTIAELQNTVTEYSNANAELQNAITEYTNNNTELQNTVAELTQRAEQLESELTAAKENASAVETVEQVDTTALEEQLNTVNTEKDNLQQQVSTLTSEKEQIESEKAELSQKVEQLESEIETLKSSVASSGEVSNSADVQAEIDVYRAKIQELSIKASEAEEAKEQAEAKVKEMEGLVDKLSDSDKKKAEELLAVIEDNKELPRSYVAVINSELLQYDEIHTFTGRVLQRLYEVKGLEASQYIFDASVFKLEHDGARKDLLMDTKSFDVNLDGIHEDEVLNKLRIVFSHFNDVAFDCKKIGTIGATYTDGTSQSDEEVNNDDFSDDNESKQETLFNDNTFSDRNGEDDFFGSNENNEDSEFNDGINFNDNTNFDSDVSFDNSTDFGEDTGDFGDSQYDQLDNNFEQEVLCCCQLGQIDMLTYSDEPIQYHNIRYIGSSFMNFDINSQAADMSNEQLLCRSVDAVLALAMAYGDTEIVSLLRKVDFRQVSENIHLFTEEFRDCPKINGTKFVVSGVESIPQAADILVNICGALNIDMSDIFMYIDVTTSSAQVIQDWGFEPDAIQLREFTKFNPDKVIENAEKAGDNLGTGEAVAVLRGDIFSNIMITKNSLQAHREVFGTTLAVKTQYFARQVNNSTDFNESIAEIVKEAMKTGRTPNFNSVGNVIGESYRLISMNPNEVNENATQMNVNGVSFYISAVEPWQIPLSLIKTHTALMANTGVAVKVNVSTVALWFFSKEYEVAEPSLSLAVESFVRYIESCTK